MAERELKWRTSSYSGTEGNCVEVALTADMAMVRDTKNRDGGTVELPAAQWSAFIDYVKRGA